MPDPSERILADGPPVPIGFLLSGGGRTLENFISILSGEPRFAHVVRVISDRQDAGGLAIAERHGIPSSVMACKKRGDGARIFQQLDRDGAHTNRDCWLSPTEALEYGLIGKVLTSLNDL